MTRPKPIDRPDEPPSGVARPQRSPGAAGPPPSAGPPVHPTAGTELPPPAGAAGAQPGLRTDPTGQPRRAEPPEPAEPGVQPDGADRPEPAGQAAPAGPAGGVRRGSDLYRAALAGLLLVGVVGVATVAPAGSHGLTQDVASWWRQAPRPLVALLELAAGVAVLAVLGVVTVDGLLRRRRALAGAVLASGVTGLVAGPVLAVVHGHGPAALRSVITGNTSAAVSAALVVAFLTGADLTTRRRWLRPAAVAVPLLVLADLALRSISPVGAAVAVLFGRLIGVAVRFAVGAAPAQPPGDRVLEALRAADLPVANLERTASEAGLSRYLAHLDGGGRLDVLVVDRDRRGSGLPARLWRLARLRAGAAGHPPLTVRGLVERQALAGYLAAARGVRVATPRALTAAGTEALILVRDQVSGTPLAGLPVGSLSPPALADAWRQLRLLHAARVAHRELTGHNVLVDADQQVVLTGLVGAEVAATELLLRLDVGQLLVTVALATGAAPAVAAMRTHYRTFDPVSVAAVLQPVALTTGTRAALRDAPGLLAELREQLLADTAEGAPARRPARLERFRPRTVLTIAAATVAAHVLLTQLSRTNPQQALARAQPGWALVALAASALTYLGTTLSVHAFAPIRLRVRRTLAVEAASSFLTLVTPPSVGQVAINVRYLQRAGLDPTAATATVAVVQLSNLVGTVALLLIGVGLTGQSIHGSALVPSGTVLTILVVVAVLLAGVAVLPATRRTVGRRVLPHVRAALPRLLDVLGQPRRLAAGLAGTLLLTGGNVVALDASVLALGVHVPAVNVAVVYLAGSAIGSAAPTPGGLGAVEAALIGGLAAIGVPASAALPAVLVFRTATFWLPVLPGWVAFAAIQRRHIV